jgi:hypothetical protein
MPTRRLPANPDTHATHFVLDQQTPAGATLRLGGGRFAAGLGLA